MPLNGHAFLMGRRRKGLYYENPDETSLVLNLGQNKQPGKAAKEVVLVGVDSSGC